MTNNKKVKIKHLVFWPPFLILTTAVVLAFINDAAFASVMTSAFDWSVNQFGWVYQLAAISILIFMFVIYFSPVSKIKFGGADAKPEFSNWNWFAMSLAGGIATGVLVWGVAEPLTHLMTPPESLGMEPFSNEAALFSLSTVYFHWTFIPYAMYALSGVAAGYAYYNLKQPFAVGSTLMPLFGERVKGKVGQLIDAVCILTIAGGMAASLGAGVLMLGRGIEHMAGITPGPMIWTGITLVIIATYTISSYSGLNKGVRILSDQNTKLFFVLIIFFLVAGPTSFIFKFGTEAMGPLLDNLFTKSLFLGAVSGDQFPNWWTLYSWSMWLAYAPMIGLFLARVSYGRTIRQFLLINMMLPAVFSIVWFAIFGGNAIHLQLFQNVDLAQLIWTEGPEIAMFTFIDQFPLAKIIAPIFFLALALSFVTLADSMTSTISLVCTSGLGKEDKEPPVLLKLIWGIGIGAMAYFMIVFASMDGVKMLAVVVGVPALFLVILQMASLWKIFFYKDGIIKNTTEMEIESDKKSVS